MGPIPCLLLALCVALPCGVAQAQSMGRGGGGVREDTKILKRYDRDGNGMLDAAERRAALTDFGFDVGQMKPVKQVGERLAPTQVKRYGNESLYEPDVLRTVFLQFDTPSWEDELAVFKDSDVKVPATLSVDGRTLRDVGVSFRGNTSFRMAGSGQKRSMNIDLDFAHKEQNILGATRLTLLNSAGDPSFLRSVMYMRIARDYYPAFRANFMRLVINGENWGIYVNQQPADRVFAHAAGGSDGPVWKTPGSPNGRAGLEYWGDDPAPYKRAFELTHRGGKPADAAWQMLVRLCRVLHDTSPEKLPAALAPLMDVDGALRFLAVDNALMNSDGYALRASDYTLYTDSQGRFHFVPHDMNESMQAAENWGGRRWRRADTPSADNANPMSLSPLAGADLPEKVLLNRLLAVPEYRQRYLGYLRDVNGRWLDWQHFSDVASRYQALIAPDIRADQRKLSSTEAFDASLAGAAGLRGFVEQRHAFLNAALESTR